MMNRQSAELTEKTSENSKLMEENKVLSQQINQLKKEVEQLESENEELASTNEKMKHHDNEYEKLKLLYNQLLIEKKKDEQKIETVHDFLHKLIGNLKNNVNNPFLILKI